jgi:predicted ATPase/class 3 adenylate cyclase
MTEHTLVFTDVVDSTRLVEQLGDARAAAVWADHDRDARRLLERYGGREIDRSDGFFLLFTDAASAVGFAHDYHQALAALGLAARVGVHSGAVTLRQNAPADVARGAKPLEIEGVAKPLAARIMALARGGQTLLSAAARAATGEALPDTLEAISHGHYRFKGLEEPVEVIEVGARVSCAFAVPQDIEKAYRVVRADALWRPAREVRHNLAAERDAFVGRRQELRRIAARLDAGSRLLSVVGPGGTGKTRLVSRYARAWLGDWPGGVYFCDLSEARGLDGICFATALALGVALGKDDAAAQLGHAIAGRGRCLIVLDNFEQIIPHAEASLGRWLGMAANAAFVVTSRERLQVQGEEIFELAPLPVESDAVELFTVRARLQRADFELDDANGPAIRHVVQLLDGLPLAIELAASRVRMLSPSQIAARLGDRFRLLTGARGAASRQATLKAAIDWSWELLEPWEQAALAQCSVFEGGFTLDAAEAVLDVGAWPDAPSVLDVVQALVDKSLLRLWRPPSQDRFAIDEPYFGMYLSIHEYAAQRLDRAGPQARAAAFERHGACYAAFGSHEALDALCRQGGAKRRHALALEIDNLVAACRRATERGAPRVAVACLRAVCEVVDLQGPLGLGPALGQQVLAMESLGDAERVLAGTAHGGALWRNGRLAEAAPVLEKALASARRLNDARSEGALLMCIGNVHREQGRMQEARDSMEAALAVLGSGRHPLGEATARWSVGTVHFDQSRHVQAREHFGAALRMHRELGNETAAGRLLSNLGALSFNEGRLEQARSDYDEACAVSRRVGDRVNEGRVLGNLALVHAHQGRMDDALACYGAALVIQRELGNRRSECVLLGNLANLRLSLALAAKSRPMLLEARTTYEDAMAIARELGQLREEGIVMGNLASLCCHFDDPASDAEAKRHFDRALEIHRSVGNRRFEGLVLTSSAELLIRQGAVAEAGERLRGAEAIFRDIADVHSLASLLTVRGTADFASGDRDAGRSALAEAESLVQSLGIGADSDLGVAIAALRDRAAAAGPA